MSLVQGNIDQAVKWRAESVMPIIQRYTDLTESEWGQDLIVWPEAAITLHRDLAANLLEDWSVRGSAAGSGLVLGLPSRVVVDGTSRYRNGVIALGAAEGEYFKRRLVPFGEYVPLEGLIRGLIAFFDLPMSRSVAGPGEQPLLQLGSVRLAMAICYEVVYPDLVGRDVPAAHVLMTISNDSWFGSSAGPRQHFQMARMRALENERFMIRATNNGVSAIIGPDGRVLAAAPQFAQAVVRGVVEPRTGATPFASWGSTPVVVGAALSLLLAAGLARRAA